VGRERFLGERDGHGQVDGDEVGEPGYRHPHQLLRGLLRVERRADDDAGFVQQPEALVSVACLLTALLK
jgi:hypothetical protein